MSQPTAQLNQGYSTASDGAPSPLPRYLAMAVVALGAAAYGLSYTTGGELGSWGVRLALVAGLLAAVGLFPRQPGHYAVVAVLAATGFFDAMHEVFVAAQRDWGLSTLVVVTALQAIAAIGAVLLHDGRAERSDEQAEYDAYAQYYAQVVQYYGQAGRYELSPEALNRDGVGQAQAPAQAVHYQGQSGQFELSPEAVNRSGIGQVQAPAHVQRPQRVSAAAQAGSYRDFIGQPSAEPAVPAPGHAGGAQVGVAGGMPSFGQAPSPANARTEHYGQPARPAAPY